MSDTHPLERLDRAVYRVEQGIITGSLLVMTFTYFVAIVHREMTAEVNAFDRLFLKWRGHDTMEGVPPEVLDAVTGVQTPVVLGIIGIIMALLAFRTRDRVGEGRTDTKPNWPVRIGLSVLSVVGVWGALELVRIVPARWMCLAVTAAMIVPPLIKSVRTGRWGTSIGFAIGASLLGWFFGTQIEDDYIWSAELSNLLLMYVGFFGASMATRDGKHITVDAIRQRVSPRYLPLYNGIGGAITVFFCGLLLLLAALYMQSSLELGHVHKATHLPKVLDVLPIVLALALMMLRFAAITYRDLRMFARGEIPEPTAPELH